MNRTLQKIPVWMWMILLGFLVWGWTLTFDFVWDDFPMILNNPSLFHWNTLVQGWANDFWMLHESPQISGYWRPIPTMIHVLLSSLFGKIPWIFHLVNILLHVSITYFFYRFLCHVEWVRWKWIPVLFFLLHPLHAETVSFLSASPDLLCAFFGWAAVVLWTDSHAKENRRVIPTFVCLMLCFLSKESGVFFGLFLVAIEFFLYRSEFKSKKSLSFYGLMVVGTVLYIIAHMAVTHGLGVRKIWGENVVFHFATVCKLFGHQLFLQIIPIHSSPTRDFAVVTTWSDIGFWTGLSLLLTVVIGFFYCRKRNSAWAFVILFYLIFWFPISNILPAEGLIANRYLYITSMAIGLGVGLTLSRFQRFPRFMVIVFVGWGCWAFSQSLPWKNQKALWTHAIEASPKSSVAWNEWGNIQLSDKKYQNARVAYEEAFRLQPQYQDASFNIAFALYMMEDFDETQSKIEDHLHRFPQDDRAYDLLGALYEQQKDYTRAIEVTQQAISLAPYQWKYRYNLAQTFFQIRDYENTIVHLKEAVNLMKDKFELWVSLAAAYCQNANYHACLNSYEEAVKRFPEKESEVEMQIKQVRQIMELTESK